MSEQVQVARKIYGKNSFQNVVNTQFSELVPKDSTASLSRSVDVSSFFEDYNSLFYDIPATGDTNSHLELINRSSDYLGISLEDLNTELQQLRNENVSLKNQILNLSK